MTRDHLRGLNKYQLKAATYGISKKTDRLPRPLLVVAGAGTGKTRVIVARAAHLVVNGVDPERILLLTFTKRAAAEVKERSVAAIRKAGFADIDLKWAGTFHSVATRLLRKYGKGIRIDPSFTFVVGDDAKAIMKGCYDRLFKDEQKPDKAIIAEAIWTRSRMVNCDLSLSKAAGVTKESQRAKRLDRLISAFQDEKKRQNVLDFDDLLVGWQRLLVGKTTHKAARRLFDYVLVDEYQDTNWLQADILRKLKPDGRGLTVVGDDAQSIYSFRGARIGNILEFPESFATKTKVIKLEQNYRSTQPILDASNAVIAKAKEGHSRILWSKKKGTRRPRLVNVPDGIAQARYVVKAIAKSRAKEIPLREQAVLFRSSMDSAELELELQRIRIPFKKYGGTRLSQAPYVRDICAILRWCQNPRDRNAGLRTLQLVGGIGEKNATSIFDAMSDTLQFDKEAEGIVPKTRVAEWRRFHDMIDKASRHAWPLDLNATLKWYRPCFEAREKNAESVTEKLHRIRGIANGYGSRDQFLSAVALEEPGAEDGLEDAADNDSLILSTIHSAKGREWRAVRVLSAVNGCIPDSRAQSVAQIEEERRLLYVAMTRAKEVLDVVVPKVNRGSYGPGYLGGFRTRLERTQFIDDSDLALYKARD